MPRPAGRFDCYEGGVGSRIDDISRFSGSRGEWGSSHTQAQRLGRMATTMTALDRRRERFHAEHQGGFAEIAKLLIRHRRGPTSSYDDAYSIVCGVADRVWTDFNGDLPDDWTGRVWNLSRSAWRDFAEGPEGTGVGGSSGPSRRRRGLITSTAELRVSLGREPTRVEIFEHYNRTNLANRADARKQGALATAADFDPPVTLIPSASPQEEQVIDDTYEAVIDRLSADASIERIVGCIQEDPGAGRIAGFARYWLTQIASGQSPTWAELAAASGVSEPTICRWMSRVRQAGVQVLSAEMVAS